MESIVKKPIKSGIDGYFWPAKLWPVVKVICVDFVIMQ